MADESEIRRELAGEREELKSAVASLREELGHAADRGKKVGAAVAAVGSVAAAVRLVRRLRGR
jgi:hypothetical protein